MTFFSGVARRLRLIPRYDSSTTVRDVAYFSGTDAHVNHKLDLFLPSGKSTKLLAPAATDDTAATTTTTATNEQEESEKKVPIIVHVHGGGWVRGSRTNEWRGGPTVGRNCAKEGYVGVIVSYRLARISPISFFAWSAIFGLAISIVSLLLQSWQLITGYAIFMSLAYVYNFLYQVRTPVNLEHMADDLCRALVYIRDHIHEYYPNADPEQIFLSGHSAGAHLVSLLILDSSHFLRHNFPLQSIRGVITISGIYTLTNPVHDSKHHINNLIFRLLYSSNLLYPEGRKIHEYSPIEYIKEDQTLPPFLVMSARYDMGLDVDARRFVDRLQQCHHQVDYHIIRGTTHGTIASKFSKHDARRHFFTFIQENMK